jgi:acetyl esterase/lipase
MRSKWASLLLLLCLASVAKAQTVINDIPYGTLAGQKLDVYPSQKANSPLIILIHGGAWFGGSKSDLSDLALFLQKRDYTVASIDYRLSWQATFPANIQDVSCAIALLQTNAATYNADPARVALLGYSAGGHLAALQATAGMKYLECEQTSDLDINAVIGVCGVYSFLYRPNSEPDRLMQMLEDSAKYWVEADPIKHLNGVGSTKFLLLTDAVDYIVDAKSTFDFYDSLQTHGLAAQMRTFYEKDHLNILANVTPEDSVISSITTFLDSLWPSQQERVLDTVNYDVDIQLEDQRIEIYSRHSGKIIIHNVLGQVVSQFDVEQGVSDHYLSNVPYGCYFVSVIADHRRTTVRVILD